MSALFQNTFTEGEHTAQIEAGTAMMQHTQSSSFDDTATTTSSDKDAGADIHFAGSRTRTSSSSSSSSKSSSSKASKPSVAYSHDASSRASSESNLEDECPPEKRPVADATEEAVE